MNRRLADLANANLAAPPIAGAVTVVQHQEIHVPRPLLACERNCVAVVGLEPRAFRRTLRLLEVPTVQTPDGPAALLADIESALRARGRPLRGEPARKRRKVAPGPSTDAAELAEMGLTRGGS
jgi:hypothetical protein